jgi:hypothetical protein
MEKNQGTAQYWDVSSSVIVDSEFFFFGDKFVKHFSLEFQQLNWFCQVFGTEHLIFL